ncbi:MAG: M56 family metallopeptidase [Flavisolibacter sp.]
MANWSQSHFLQSLGWATLNSFWQIALLWCIFCLINHLFKLPSFRKYQLSVAAMFSGFVWFVITFIYFFQSSSISVLSFFNQSIEENNTFLNVALISASVSYLALLCFPSYRLFRNWQFVQRIKKYGLRKANLNHRLFVQNISGLMGIRKKVGVYLSDLVNSPVTIGYLKPIILLPVAAMNHLSTVQVEAILLHELSHIRRYDYLVNLMISVINTVLYFNPFVKLFMKSIEEERENCCDQLVLQFGYDKVGYASALLALEKLSVTQQILALGASGSNYLLTRIEKIVGMEKKKGFKRNQFAGILAALFLIVIFNSILIIREKRDTNFSFTYQDNISSPFAMFDAGNASRSGSVLPEQKNQEDKWTANVSTQKNKSTAYSYKPVQFNPELFNDPSINEQIINVAADEVDASLSKEEKDKVKSTVAATKKVLSSLQWKDVENNYIGDAMNEQEKTIAKQEYMKALEKTVSWQNIEQNLKSKYNEIDWIKLNSNISTALTTIKLDSLQKSYSAVLAQLDKANADASCNKSTTVITPMPDISLIEIRKSRDELRKKVDTIRAIRNPKIIVRL